MPDKVSTTRYNKAPQFLGKGRTRFDLSHNILTTFNTGELVPILIEPIVPGSTFSLKTASLTRLETSLHQTMDNAYIEFAQRQGYKHIYLAGHSLGANKVIYYLSRHHDKRVEKFLLLSPAI